MTTIALRRPNTDAFASRALAIAWGIGVALLVGGCAPEFAGTYGIHQEPVTSGSCAITPNWPIIDGSVRLWDVSQAGEVVTIASSVLCPSFIADATGSTARLRRSSCPTFIDGTSTVDLAYTGGTLALEVVPTLNDPRQCDVTNLLVTLSFEAHLSGSAQDCSGSTTLEYRKVNPIESGCPSS